jgi:hypothetical protein
VFTVLCLDLMACFSVLALRAWYRALKVLAMQYLRFSNIGSNDTDKGIYIGIKYNTRRLIPINCSVSLSGYEDLTGTVIMCFNHSQRSTGNHYKCCHGSRSNASYSLLGSRFSVSKRLRLTSCKTLTL